MSAYADCVVNYLFAQSWQIALLGGMVGLISWVLRNRSAHLRYLLWLIVLAKCLVPPFLTVPLAVLPERAASPSVAETGLAEEHSAWETPVAAAETPLSPEQRPPAPSSREVLAFAWAAGVLLFLLWVGGRAVRYSAWLRTRRLPLPPAVQDSIEELSLGFRFRKWPRIWLLGDIRQPFVWGLLRGSVYLPADFMSLSGSDRRRSILAHELSHVARLDAGVNLLQVLAQAAYWFHPFVWWANRKIRQEREKCCDEMAIAHLNTPPEEYTGAIVDALAAERRSAHPIPSLAIVGSVKDIEERIKAMLRPGKTFRTRPSLVAATVALLMALATIPTALVLTAKGQTQPTIDGVAKAVAVGEKSHQPGCAARIFNSKMAFTVHYRNAPGWSQSWRGGGRTPSDAPVQIPACWLWWVETEDGVIDWDLLVREIRENMVPGLRVSRATDPDVQRLAGLTGLRLLDLEGSQITDAGLAYLKEMSGLEALGLSGTKITDAGLEHLKGLTRLRGLQLRRAAITDVGLKHLQGLTALQRLDLGQTGITDAGLELLKDLTELQHLDLGGTGITGEGLKYLKGLPGLQELFAGKTQITDASLEHLKGMTTLRTLRLVGTKITDAGLACLRGLTGLQILVLDGTQVTDVGLVHLNGLAALQYVSLGRTQVTDAGIQRLKQSLPTLTIVGGDESSRTQSADQAGAASEKPTEPRYAARTFNSGVAFDVFALTTSGGRWKTVGRTPSATPVEIPACWLWWVRPLGPVENWDLLVREMSRNKVPGLDLDSATDSDLKRVSADLRELQRLGLSKTQVTDAGLAHLPDLTQLQWLNLSNTNVTDTGLAHLASLTRLRWLDLGSTEITDAGLEHLKGLTGLRSLNVFGTQITDAGVGHCKGMSGMEVLLASGKLTDAVIEHVKGMTRLQDLYLSGRFTDAGLVHLKGLTRLQSLGLDSNRITDAGIEHLRGLTGLEDLILSGTQLTNAGLVHLKGLTRLQNLNVTDSQITDAGLEYLKDLTSLRILNLSSTKITDAGLAHFLDLTRLEAVVLSDTQVTDAGVRQLKQSLPKLEIARF